MAHNGKSTDAGYRWQHFHQALRLDHVLTVKAKREEPMSVFVSQSALDGACGLHCVCMALVILNLAKSHALTEMSSRKYGVPADVWRALGDTYFAGVEPPELVNRLSRLDLPLRISARFDGDRRLDRFAIDNLQTGEIVLVAVRSVKNRRTRHWTLGVGAGGASIGRKSLTDTLYLLDPSASSPEFTLFNARLTIHGPHRGLRGTSSRTKSLLWYYDSLDWDAEPVRLTGAVRLRRA